MLEGTLSSESPQLDHADNSVHLLQLSKVSAQDEPDQSAFSLRELKASAAACTFPSASSRALDALLIALTSGTFPTLVFCLHPTQSFVSFFPFGGGWYVSVSVCVCVHVCTSVRTYPWRPEVKPGYSTSGPVHFI